MSSVYWVFEKTDFPSLNSLHQQIKSRTNYEKCPLKLAPVSPVANYLQPAVPSKPKQTYGLLLACGPGNTSRDRKWPDGAGLASARPVTAVISRVYAIVL